LRICTQLGQGGGARHHAPTLPESASAASLKSSLRRRGGSKRVGLSLGWVGHARGPSRAPLRPPTGEIPDAGAWQISRCPYPRGGRGARAGRTWARAAPDRVRGVVVHHDRPQPPAPSMLHTCGNGKNGTRSEPRWDDAGGGPMSGLKTGLQPRLELRRGGGQGVRRCFRPPRCAHRLTGRRGRTRRPRTPVYELWRRFVGAIISPIYRLNR
jgi:hypothetical protein